MRKRHGDTIYLIDGVRTPISNPYKSLKGFTVAQMSALLIKEILKRNKIKKKLVGEVILGNTVSAGTGQNFSRQAAFLAKLPITVPAYTVNNVCGSGLQAVILAMQSIRSKNADFIIAGGAESVTHTPNLVSKDECVAMKDKFPIDSLVYDGLWDLLTGKHMGELCEELAQSYNISRTEQDEFSFESHKKAQRAIDEGVFSNEIIGVQVSSAKTFDRDERPRRNVKMESFLDLPPAFKNNGTITAGSAAPPSDGAAVVLVASKESVRKYNISPRARVLGYSLVAVDPNLTFLAGVSAIEKCLEERGLTIKDIDLFELSEAFAAQVILTRNKLKIPNRKINIYGGDIALGHPLGAAGARALVTLMHALVTQKKRRGIACVCLGGGGAVAMAIEVCLS